MHWGKENLAHLSKNDLYFIGNGYGEELLDEDESDTLKKESELTPKSSSMDFALLASCNHTIGSRGTYSIWASRFAGGEILTEFSRGYKEFKEGYKSSSLFSKHDLHPIISKLSVFWKFHVCTIRSMSE